MSEFDEYFYTQEFIDLAKEKGIKPVQLEMSYFICQSFKKRGKCNDKCIYKQFNFCIEYHELQQVCF